MADILLQLIPSEIKWEPNETPSMFTNHDDIKIKVGTQVRIKIMGTRAEVGELWAIGSIKEDYLGYVFQPSLIAGHTAVLTDILRRALSSESNS
jgi:DNA-directed RNA polymerase subunit E'/Rpb7